MPAQNDAYRGPVEMSGWVNKYGNRLKTRQVRRYFKLNNEILTNHQKLTSPPTWEVSISKCIVKVDEDECIVTIRLLDNVIRFQVATVGQTRRWQEAVRTASRCKIEDFYKLGKELGTGAFGSVHLAFDLATGEKRAVKIVNRTTNAKELEFMQREINVLLSIGHEFIVKTYDVFDERNKIYLVLEYVNGGDFFDYMAKRTKLPEFQAKVILWQILEGLQYLHINSIVHRDIKPENVLIAQEDPIICKLTDFGFANFLDPNSAAPQTDMKSMVGTGCYMSPEIMDARGHGKPVDLFATGVVLYRVIAGKLPFRGMSMEENYNQAVQGRADFNGREWRGVSPDCKNVCAALLHGDPVQRPTTAEALAHSWFADDEQFQIEKLRYDGHGVKKGSKRHQGAAASTLQSLRNIIMFDSMGSSSGFPSPGVQEPRSLQIPRTAPRNLSSPGSPQVPISLRDPKTAPFE